MCPVTGLEVANLKLPLPFSYTRGAKIMTGVWYHLVSACEGACTAFLWHLRQAIHVPGVP